MSQIQNKIAGWILLASGVIVIIWSLYSSFEIFSAKTKAPEIFKSSALLESEKKPNDLMTADSKLDQLDPAKLRSLSSKDLENLKSEQQQEMQTALENSINSQFEKIIPADLMPKMMNLTSWSIFMFILVYAGSKVSSLGIQLLKD